MARIDVFEPLFEQPARFVGSIEQERRGREDPVGEDTGMGDLLRVGAEAFDEVAADEGVAADDRNRDAAPSKIHDEISRLLLQ